MGMPCPESYNPEFETKEPRPRIAPTAASPLHHTDTFPKSGEHQAPLFNLEDPWGTRATEGPGYESGYGVGNLFLRNARRQPDFFWVPLGGGGPAPSWVGGGRVAWWVERMG